MPASDERAYGHGLGFTDVDVDGMAEDLRLWARGGGATRQDWAAVFKGWMRREQRERPARGPRPPPAGPPRRPAGADFFTALAREADDSLKRRLQS
jgi:hypothetical protein